MRKICLFILSVLSLVSCRNQIDFDDLKEIKSSDQTLFAEEFTARYGTVSPDITWMTASCDTIQADLSALNAGQYTIQVFTSDPDANADNCYLLAEYTNQTGGSVVDVVYDHPTGLKNVYVTATSDDSIRYVATVENAVGPTACEFDPEVSFVRPRQYKPMGYLICFDGFTGDEKLDFDYNDVIVEVQYVRGRSEATILTRAAGSNCAAKVVYHRSGDVSDSSHEDVLFEEIHESMGYEGVFDYVLKHLVYVKMNTGVNKAPMTATATLDLGSDAGLSILSIAPKFITYFTIRAEKKKDEKTTSAFIPLKSGAQYPMAILVADPTWQWAQETILLSSAHSTFNLWIYDPSKYPLWYGGEIWKEANKNFE